MTPAWKWAALWAIFMCYSLWGNKVTVRQCPGTTAFKKKEGATTTKSKPTSACLPSWCLTAGPDQLTPPQSFTPLQFRISLSFSLQQTFKVSVMSKTKDCSERFHFSFWGKFWQLMMQKCPNVHVSFSSSELPSWRCLAWSWLPWASPWSVDSRRSQSCTTPTSSCSWASAWSPCSSTSSSPITIIFPCSISFGITLIGLYLGKGGGGLSGSGVGSYSSILQTTFPSRLWKRQSFTHPRTTSWGYTRMGSCATVIFVILVPKAQGSARFFQPSNRTSACCQDSSCFLSSESTS